MVRRVIQSDFMPDVYVFPGGSVSADDRAAELAPDVCMPVIPDASAAADLLFARLETIEPHPFQPAGVP